MGRLSCRGVPREAEYTDSRTSDLTAGTLLSLSLEPSTSFSALSSPARADEAERPRAFLLLRARCSSALSLPLPPLRLLLRPRLLLRLR